MFVQAVQLLGVPEHELQAVELQVLKKSIDTPLLYTAIMISELLANPRAVTLLYVGERIAN